MTEEHVDAKVTEAICRIGGADVCTQPPHPSQGDLEIDMHTVSNLNAKSSSITDGSGNTSCTNHTFRRYAADSQTIATHQLSFDECHGRAQSRGTGCRHQPGRACSNHN